MKNLAVSPPLAYCPFLDFDVLVEPQKALLQLSLTGPQNIRQFLQAEFADILQS